MDVTLASNIAADGSVALYGYTASTNAFSSYIRKPNGTFVPISDPKAGPGGTLIGDVNARGDAIGAYFVRGPKSREIPFVYINGVYRRPVVPGAKDVGVEGINSHGDYAGVFVDRHGVQHGFTRVGGKLHIINIPGASHRKGFGTTVADIADNGTIAGNLATGRYRAKAFVRHNGHVYYLSRGADAEVGCVDNNGDVGFDTFPTHHTTIGYLARR